MMCLVYFALELGEKRFMWRSDMFKGHLIRGHETVMECERFIRGIMEPSRL